MSDRTLGIPLAFVLALSAAGANEEVLKAKDSAELLRPGSLGQLLDQGKSGGPEGGAGSGIRERAAQWFNFFNCFAGMWRRC